MGKYTELKKTLEKEVSDDRRYQEMLSSDKITEDEKREIELKVNLKNLIIHRDNLERRSEKYAKALIEVNGDIDSIVETGLGVEEVKREVARKEEEAATKAVEAEDKAKAEAEAEAEAEVDGKKIKLNGVKDS